MKTYFRTILAFITVVAGSFLFLTAPALAVNVTSDACGGNTTSSVCTTNQTTNPITGKDGVMTKAVNLFSLIVGAVAVVAIALAGFRFITANGDSNDIANARNSILFAIVGLVIVLIAQSIVIFVLNKL